MPRLVRQVRHVGDRRGGVGGGEPDPAGSGTQLRLVTDRQDRGETDAEPADAPPSRFAEARNEVSASMPAAVSGSPVFAADSATPPSTVDTSRSRSRPGTPARAAASAAFCASSTSSRSA
ncbi:hypothetical protein Athai_03420 [Actinocatenispora thailandica]|uniref:Uncharacterized protein n=1 Tax=Actinocatenispora thailandica TaxID=227318 RepID=A0A7R7HVG2_9ACTN|nr:hypothetical protein Athai_03420 [Actinocatenispora thailandica]